MSAAFIDIHDVDGSGILRLKTADGYRDATEADIKMMLAAPLLADVLKRIVDGEFGYGQWPSQKEIFDALATAGVKP